MIKKNLTATRNMNNKCKEYLQIYWNMQILPTLCHQRMLNVTPLTTSAIFFSGEFTRIYTTRESKVKLSRILVKLGKRFWKRPSNVLFAMSFFGMQFCLNISNFCKNILQHYNVLAHILWPFCMSVPSMLGRLHYIMWYCCSSSRAFKLFHMFNYIVKYCLII